MIYTGQTTIDTDCIVEVESVGRREGSSKEFHIRIFWKTNREICIWMYSSEEERDTECNKLIEAWRLSNYDRILQLQAETRRWRDAHDRLYEEKSELNRQMLLLRRSRDNLITQILEVTRDPTTKNNQLGQ